MGILVMAKEQIALLVLSLSIGLALAVDICEYQMNGAHLAHPADCNKFVECQNGRTYRIASCPLGLHFNRFKGVCDLRQRAGCDIEFVNFLSEEANNCSACCQLYGCYIKPDCPPTPGPTTTVIIPSTPSIPEPSTENPETLSTPTTYVTDSTPVPSDSTPVIPDTSTTPVSTEIPRPETPVTPDIPAINQCPNNLTVCQSESDNSTMHVNGTCNQYIVCANGCAYIMPCPANLQYDIARQICDYPQNVKCPWQSTTAITGPSGVTCAHHGQCANQTDGKLFANPNGDGYIICQCECEIERPCPQGTKFNAHLLACAWKAGQTENGNESDKKYETDGAKGNKNKHTNDGKTATEDGSSGGSETTISTVCLDNVEVCRNQTEGKLLPVNGICNKFYECNFGCAIEILCPNNLIYNPQVEYCDYPHNYKCPWPYTPPSGPSAGPSGIACASGGRCVGKLDGALLPSRTSCAKYVVCQCECEVERDCGKNLHWDRDLLTCNYAANVTCELNL